MIGRMRHGFGGPLLAVIACAAGCAGRMAATLRGPVEPVSPAAHIDVPCASCAAIPMSDQVMRAVEERITDLGVRGGDCRAYGEVLDRSYRSGQITIRPYMWRVGTHLAAGEAKPSGEMTLAREIDSLNVGRRTIDELTWSMEHEAVHIAFRISSGPRDNEDAVDAYVRSCRS